MKTKVVVFLLSLISPFWSFMLWGRRYLPSFFGLFMLLLTFIQLNLCLVMSQGITDTHDYIASYKDLLDGVLVLSLSDYYFILSLYSFAYFHISPIGIFLFWTIVYYLGICMLTKELYKYIIDTPIFWLLFFCALFSINFMEFAQMRFFTGAIWTIYVIIKLLPYSVSLKYLYLVIAPFFHFALILPALVFLLVKLIGPKTKNLFRFAVISILFQFLPVGYFEFLYTGGVGYSSYLTVTRNNAVYEGSGVGRFFYLPLMVLLISGIWRLFKKRKYFGNDLNFLHLGLIAFILFNLVSVSAEYTSRYKHMMVWLCVFPILYYWKNYNVKPMKIYVIGIPLAMFLFVFDLFYQFEVWVHWDRLFFSSFYGAFSECFDTIKKITR